MDFFSPFLTKDTSEYYQVYNVVKIIDGRLLKSIILCLTIVFIFAMFLRVDLIKKIFCEMSHSDPLWESLDAKYFALSGDFKFSFRTCPSDKILMPHFAETHFLIHKYIVGLAAYLSRINVLTLWNLYGFFFYILGMSSVFYFLWLRFSFFTALFAVIIGFFNNAFLPFVFYSLGDNSQIAASTFLIILVSICLNSRFIYIFMLYIYTFLTSFSAGSAIAAFLLAFYGLNILSALKNKNLNIAKQFSLYILLLSLASLILYALLSNNMALVYSKKVLLDPPPRVDKINFINLGFIYIAASLSGIFFFLKKNFRKDSFYRETLLLLTSSGMLSAYFTAFWLRGLGINLSNNILVILCTKYYIYIFPLILFIGYGVHHFTLNFLERRQPDMAKRTIPALIFLFALFSFQKVNYVYNNIRLMRDDKLAFSYIYENFKKRIGMKYSIPRIGEPWQGLYAYEHNGVDKDFFKTKMGIPYTCNFDIERDIGRLITINDKFPLKKVVVNSNAHGAKIALSSGCIILSEYISPQAWEDLFMMADDKKTKEILMNPERFRSDYISDFENYFYFPELVKILPSSEKNYGKIDYVIFYYSERLNLEKALNKFLNSPSDYKLVGEYSRSVDGVQYAAKDKVFVFKVL